MSLTIEVLQANDGDCLLLRYIGEAKKQTLVLIDGGSKGVYKNVIKPRLNEIADGKPLDLRMVMVSHIDADHITGIQDMLRDLLKIQQSGDLPYRIRTLWHNSFEKLTGGRKANAESAAVGASVGGVSIPGLDEQAAAVVASVTQGNDVRNSAIQLAIPLNQGAKGDLVKAPAKTVLEVELAPGFRFTVLGPHDEQLEALDAEWQKAKIKNKTPKGQAADYSNRTVPNLSSIVVLAEVKIGSKTRRLLLTGDAGGDHILETLQRSKMMKNGKFEVDLLKVQHHGSNHSVDLDFFKTVIAPVYVICGNGAHGIPHPDTLGWLSEARKDKPYEVYFTNRKGNFKKPGDNGLTKMFDKFLASEKKNQSRHVYHFRPEKDLFIPVEIK